MSVSPKARSSLCHVLDEDPELADAVPAASREHAVKECLARVVAIPSGRWKGAYMAGEGIGLLVLDGLLIRRVGVDGRFGAELLGEGDLLRPWQGEDEQPTPPRATGWSVLESTRVAVLDEAFARRAARYPQLIGRLVGRALERSRYLAVNMAIVHQPRVEVRLHMLFWHLATRWGRVRSDGVNLPLRLTHNVLADLAAARRATVTSALSDLARHGLVRTVEAGWLLTGDPPSELLELEAVSPSLADKAASEDS